jgi:hypothetical protein
MDAPDGAVFAALRKRFISGIVHPSPGDQQATAERVLQILKGSGDDRLAAELKTLPPGLFWPLPNAGI